jgi:hypothetical protein
MLKMIELNVKIVVSEEKYNEMIENIKDVSGVESKEYLEEYIGSSLEYDIEENGSEFLFDFEEERNGKLLFLV